MALDHITSYFDFREYFKELVTSAEAYDGSLEEFLRAILRSIIRW